MARVTFLILLCATVASAAWAGRLGIGLGVAVYKPAEEGSSYTPLFSAHGHYWVNKHVVPSLEVGYSRYTISGTTYNYVPVIPRVTYHFALSKIFDPYAGLGLVYAHKWWDGEENGKDDSWGFAGSTGFNLAASEKFGINLGVEYVVPDIDDFDSAYPAFKFGLGAGGF